MRLSLFLLFALSCSSAPPRPPFPVGAKTLRLEPTRMTPLCLCRYDHWLGSSAALYSPSLRFDLSSFPKDALLRRALLRLRRGYERTTEHRGPTSYRILATNVNKGLKIAQAKVSEAWQHPGEILAAEPVTGEDALWSPVPGGPFPGLALVQAEYSRQPYVAWLRSWNPTVPARLEEGAEWDELDVTAFVAAELAGDRSLTLLLSSETAVHVRWFDATPDLKLGSRVNRPEYHPHLTLEFDPAAEKTEPPPAASGRLALRSTPAPAKIYLDGEFVGTTLEDQVVEFSVKGPRVQVRFEKRGFKAWEETVRTSESHTTPVHAELHAE